jgi:cysteine-rich repeat protein
VRTAIPSLAAVFLLGLVLTVSCNGDGGGGVFEDCGNGTIEGSEQCDDGNTVPCDGCSADCDDEVGYICGDGIVNTTCGEQCDDGNNLPGDGCDANCLSEGCGNGVLDPGEECDDGNLLPCDGCSDTCTIESGLVCGDGIQNAACGEECDDGKVLKCDGCSDACLIEIGLVCGDGILNTACGEECDDGNNLPGDGCDANCRIEPLSIAGEYDLNITLVLDTCDFGATSTTSPMEVIELTQTQATVNIPIGGAGGECNRETYFRQGNVLTRNESSLQQIGPCTVQVDVTTSLTFFDDDTVTGFETNQLTAAGGDCSGLVLPCETNFTVAGSRCSGCFSCVMPSTATARVGLGSFATGAGATLDSWKERTEGR